MLGELPNKALHLTASREAAADEPGTLEQPKLLLLSPYRCCC